VPDVLTSSVCKENTSTRLPYSWMRRCVLMQAGTDVSSYPATSQYAPSASNPPPDYMMSYPVRPQCWYSTLWEYKIFKGRTFETSGTGAISQKNGDLQCCIAGNRAVNDGQPNLCHYTQRRPQLRAWRRKAEMLNIGDLRPVDQRLGMLLLLLLYQPSSSVNTVTGCGPGDWVSVTGGESG